MTQPTTDGVHKSLANWPYRKIFLTGATGLIGGQMLHDMLQLPQVEEVVCLARPADRKTGLERLVRRLKKTGLKGDQLDKAMTRVRAVDGEIIQKLWAMSAEDLDYLRNNCELFVHCAASTSFVDVESCEAINVLGTKNMLDVLEGAKALKRLVHFSTSTLCGYLPNRVITEDESPNPKHLHVVAYTRTKAEAERILWAQADKLPLLVVRPSITMASGSEDPKHARLFLWSLRVMGQLPMIPIKHDSRIDIVTLDFVVKSTMRLIAKGDKLSHNCYHLTAGKEAAVTAGHATEVSCTAARTEGPELINPDEWTDDHEKKLEEQGLDTLYESLTYLPFINLNLVFDKTRLINELGPDLPDLQPFTEYLPQMLHLVLPDMVTLENIRGFGN